MNAPLRRTVSFNESVRCRVFPNNYTDDEIASMWYNKEELRSITKRCYLLLKKIENGGSRSGKTYCMRGLEGYSTTGSMHKRTIKSNAISAVLEEQERQLFLENNTELDDEAIANAYKKMTAKCKHNALVTAKRDQLSAMAINPFVTKNKKSKVELSCVAHRGSREVGFVSGMLYSRERAVY